MNNGYSGRIEHEGCYLGDVGADSEGHEVKIPYSAIGKFAFFVTDDRLTVGGKHVNVGEFRKTVMSEANVVLV